MMFRLAVLAAYLRTRRQSFADRAALERWQAHRLRQALSRARARFAFYRDVCDDTLASFPILDKTTWLENFSRLNDRGLALDDCLRVAREAEARRTFTAQLGGVSIGLSTGTSGRQGVFLTSSWERAQWAGSILARALPAGLRGGARVALILRSGGPLYEAVGGGRVSFRFFDLAQPLEDQTGRLDAFAPTVVVAPPQALVRLAALRRAGTLQSAPSTIYSSAEVLDPADRDDVEQAFGLRLGEIYQATEGFLGITCAAGALHLNEDLVVVEREWVDRATKRFVPVVTDLYRRTQAIVRYRMGDVLIDADAPCLCGSPFATIARIEGRTDDVLGLPTVADADVTRAVFPDFVRGAVLGVPGVDDFRVIQNDADHLTLAVRPDGLYDRAAAALLELCARLQVRPPRISAGTFEPFAPTVKLRRVRRVGSRAPLP